MFGREASCYASGLRVSDSEGQRLVAVTASVGCLYVFDVIVPRPSARWRQLLYRLDAGRTNSVQSAGQKVL